MIWLVAAGALLQGAGNAIVGHLVDGRSVFWFTGIAFLATSFLGQALRFRRRGSRRPRMRLVDVLALNAATAVTFVSFYLSLVAVPSSLAAGVEAAVAPLAALALSGLRGHRARARDWLLVLPLFGSSIAFGWSRHEALAASPSAFIGGMALAAVAGIGMAYLAILSKRLGDQGHSASDVISVRFHLTYITSLGIALFQGGSSSDGMAIDFGWIIPLGIAAVAVPLFLIQFGMMKAAPSLTVVMMACVPAVSFVVESSVLRLPAPAISRPLVAVLVALICANGLFRGSVGADEAP
jgi:drug/metabolite transporter (DMT)-like permease